MLKVTHLRFQSNATRRGRNKECDKSGCKYFGEDQDLKGGIFLAMSVSLDRQKTPQKKQLKLIDQVYIKYSSQLSLEDREEYAQILKIEM